MARLVLPDMLSVAIFMFTLVANVSMEMQQKPQAHDTHTQDHWKSWALMRRQSKVRVEVSSATTMATAAHRVLEPEHRTHTLMREVLKSAAPVKDEEDFAYEDDVEVEDHTHKLMRRVIKPVDPVNESEDAAYEGSIEAKEVLEIGDTPKQQTPQVELDMSQEAVHQRYRTRVRLIIEHDLGKFDGKHYRAYHHNQTLEDNFKDFFHTFLAESGLRGELDNDETANFYARFLDECQAVFKGGDTSNWEFRVSAILQNEKPEVTEALVESVNTASLGFMMKMQGWMANQSHHDCEKRLGFQETEADEDNALLEQARRTGVNKTTGNFEDLLSVSFPATMSCASKWEACKGVIERHHQQGTCGSCWAFAAMSPLESRLCIKSDGEFSGERAMISRQWVTSCTYPKNKNGCEGGHMYEAYRKFTKKADSAPSGGKLSSGEDFGCSPYFGKGSSVGHFSANVSASDCPTWLPSPACPNLDYERPLSKDHYHFRTMTMKKILRRWGNRDNPDFSTYFKATLYRDGPVSFALKSNSAFQGYSSGVFKNLCSLKANHAVTAIGYDHDDSGDIIQGLNSWGTWWGDNNKFWIEICSVQEIVLFDFDLQADRKKLPDPIVPGGASGPGPVPSPGPCTTAWCPEVENQPCLLDHNGCIMSSNYDPDRDHRYGNDEYCSFQVTKNNFVIEVVDFNVEVEWDKFTVNGENYDNDNFLGRLQGVRPQGSMSWSTDSNEAQTGWKLCPKEESTETPTQAPTTPPTEAATEAPTEAATEAPTEAPTAGPPKKRKCRSKCKKNKKHLWWTQADGQRRPKCARWACNGCPECSEPPSRCMAWCHGEVGSLNRKCTVWDGCADCEICLHHAESR